MSLEENRFFRGEISSGETKQFILDIPENTKNLKVTLVWNDPAAEVNSDKALVNDLDMILTHETSAIRYLPWVLNPISSR